MFQRGEFFVHLFRFPQGEIRLEAIAVTSQTTLRLLDVDIAPEGDQVISIGFRGIRRAITDLCALGLEQGFTTIIVSGFRVSGARPGRDIEWTLPCNAH
jgi:hypothetical protein